MTLVPVIASLTNEPAESFSLKKVYESLFRNAASPFLFKSSSHVTGNRVQAPAASVGPSWPSLPQLINTPFISAFADWPPSNPCRAKEKARTISWFLPPNPVPVTWTVVSPPQSRQSGEFQSMLVDDADANGGSSGGWLRWPVRNRMTSRTNCANAVAASLVAPWRHVWKKWKKYNQKVINCPRK